MLSWLSESPSSDLCTFFPNPYVKLEKIFLTFPSYPNIFPISNPPPVNKLAKPAIPPPEVTNSIKFPIIGESLNLPTHPMTNCVIF